MSIIALLDLPLELAHDAPARRSGLTSFVDGLPQWLSRCRSRPGAAGSRSKLTLA
jgi:protein farnesyltransferase subunit beta